MSSLSFLTPVIWVFSVFPHQCSPRLTNCINLSKHWVVVLLIFSLFFYFNASCYTFIIPFVVILGLVCSVFYNVFFKWKILYPDGGASLLCKHLGLGGSLLALFSCAPQIFEILFTFSLPSNYFLNVLWFHPWCMNHWKVWCLLWECFGQSRDCLIIDFQLSSTAVREHIFIISNHWHLLKLVFMAQNMVCVGDCPFCSRKQCAFCWLLGCSLNVSEVMWLDSVGGWCCLFSLSVYSLYWVSGEDYCKLQLSWWTYPFLFLVFSVLPHTV